MISKFLINLYQEPTTEKKIVGTFCLRKDQVNHVLAIIQSTTYHQLLIQDQVLVLQAHPYLLTIVPVKWQMMYLKCRVFVKHIMLYHVILIQNVLSVIEIWLNHVNFLIVFIDSVLNVSKILWLLNVLNLFYQVVLFVGGKYHCILILKLMINI